MATSTKVCLIAHFDISSIWNRLEECVATDLLKVVIEFSVGRSKAGNFQVSIIFEASKTFKIAAQV